MFNDLDLIEKQIKIIMKSTPEQLEERIVEDALDDMAIARGEI